MKLKISPFLLLLMILSIVASSATAQDACPILVKKALEGLEANCTDVTLPTPKGGGF